MRTGILVIDNNGHIKMTNEAAVHLLEAEDIQQQLNSGVNPPLPHSLTRCALKTGNAIPRQRKTFSHRHDRT